MNAFLEYLFVIALFALITLPSLVGHARDRAVDRQLREARGRLESGRRAAATTAGAHGRRPAPRLHQGTGRDWGKAA
ncbi:hypothetical protein [Streptomyces sp. NBC_00467]|uniref:hypothetical protein n=1 Tax=Streptomyces sp. NBC_00467 TaxID=2975752 RepID=UPI002E1870A9